MKDLNIAIVGAGLGGLTAAASLQSFGFKVEVYEQAAMLGEIGAGISLPPNSTRSARRGCVRPADRVEADVPWGILDYSLAIPVMCFQAVNAGLCSLLRFILWCRQ